MKKLLLIAVSALLASCGGNQQAQQPKADSTATTTQVAEVKTDNASDPATDAKVTEMVNEFYPKYVFGGEETNAEILGKYCTKKLIQKLADDYDYDGEGYAVWNFRDSGNDSPVNKVLDVKPLGNYKYKVIMNNDFSCIITVVKENDKVLFDETDNSQETK